MKQSHCGLWTACSEVCCEMSGLQRGTGSGGGSFGEAGGNDKATISAMCAFEASECYHAFRRCWNLTNGWYRNYLDLRKNSLKTPSLHAHFISPSLRNPVRPCPPTAPRYGPALPPRRPCRMAARPLRLFLAVLLQQHRHARLDVPLRAICIPESPPESRPGSRRRLHLPPCTAPPLRFAPTCRA